MGLIERKERPKGKEVQSSEKEDLYAFYHPTFQEYFAACNIDDWDYFLPRAHIDRPVPCQGEDKPIYQIFEQEWREVIFLWFGGHSINGEDKNNFIKRIEAFNDGYGEYKFYVERSRYLISVLTSILVPKVTRQQDEVREQEDEDEFNQIRQLLTKDNSMNKDKLDVLINSILLKDYYFEGNSIKFTLHDKINAGFETGKIARQSELSHFFPEKIIQYIDRDSLSEEQEIFLAATLIGFDIKHPKALNTFDSILISSDNFHHKIYIAEILFGIDETAKSVKTLEEILCDPSLNGHKMSWLFNPIIRICKDEITTIRAVIRIIKNHPSKDVRSGCIRVLAYISNDINQESTDILAEILSSKEYDNDLKNSALRTVGIMGNKNPVLVKILHLLVGDKNDDNSLLAGRILSSWIGYPKFYTLYHSN